MLRIRLLAAWVTLGISLTVPSVLLAQDYDMTFTLPTAGKSGCLVCHGDSNLVRVDPSGAGGALSYFVDESILQHSAHGKSKKYPNGINCTACHTDFAYKAPHKNGDWRRSAKLACKNCKDHQDEFDAYGRGVHSIAPRPGATPEETAKDAKKPLCGDCHSHAHAIRIMTPEGAEAAGVEYDPTARRDFHGSGRQTCGRSSDCHAKEWDNYQDYYHGAAYRRGATDAPACWQCHGAHDILSSDKPRSYTNEANLVQTCGNQAVEGEPCHSRLAVGEDEFVKSYKEFVHRRADQYESNWLYAQIRKSRQGISQAFSMFKDFVKGLFK